MFTCPVRPAVELRQLTPRDAAALAAHMEANREHLQVWMDEADTIQTERDAREWLESVASMTAARKGLGCGIWVEGDFAGTIGFHDLHSGHRWAGLGYWLGEPWLGQGIVTDCVRVLLTYAFDELDLHKIEIHCPVTNLRSRGVPERLGFQLEGIRRECYWLRGWPHDLAIYGMLAGEWWTQRTPDASDAAG